MIFQVADLRDQLREQRETCDQLMMDNYKLETNSKTLQKDIIELKAAKTRLQLALDDKITKEQQYIQAGTCNQLINHQQLEFASEMYIRLYQRQLKVKSYS